MSDSGPRDRLRGITFAKQFPNAAEPLRGLFVAEQVAATAAHVEWNVIAPAPWAPRWLATALRKPYVRGDEARDGVPVHHPTYPVLPRRLLYGTVASAMAAAARPAFEDVVTRLRPHFVHAHALYPSAAAARRLAAEHALPLVVTVHGSDLYTNLAHGGARRELSAAIAAAAHIVCVSRGLERDLRSLESVDDSRITVVPDTYDEALFSFVDRPAHSGPPRLIATGRLVDVKDHAILIDAVATLKADGVDVSLVIVGDGPLRAALTSRAMDAGVADVVRFAGGLSQSDLQRELAAADLFVLPSKREGFGVAVVEALATGLPAVVTRSGGPEDVVREEDGITVAPRDRAALAAGVRAALDRTDSFDRVRIARDARDRFGRRSVGDRLVDIYREVAAHAPTRS